MSKKGIYMLSPRPILTACERLWIADPLPFPTVQKPVIVNGIKPKGNPKKQAMNTMKLTLGQAAKHAGRAKGTLSKALTNGQISAEKDGKGRWQIEPSEFQRWMEANPLPNTTENQDTTPLEIPKNPNGNSALEVEVKMLREQMDEIRSMNERERQTLVDQIEDLKTEAERRSREHMQALAVLTDQREKAPEPPKRGFWARLTG